METPSVIGLALSSCAEPLVWTATAYTCVAPCAWRLRHPALSEVPLSSSRERGVLLHCCAVREVVLGTIEPQLAESGLLQLHRYLVMWSGTGQRGCTRETTCSRTRKLTASAACQIPLPLVLAGPSACDSSASHWQMFAMHEGTSARESRLSITSLFASQVQQLDQLGVDGRQPHRGGLPIAGGSCGGRAGGPDLRLPTRALELLPERGD